MTQKVCVVTGATGFIGQHILSELVANKYKVIGIGKSEEIFCPEILNENKVKYIIKSEIDGALLQYYDVEIILGEISDKQFVEQIFNTIARNNLAIEFILHFAACATIQKAREDEKLTWKTNYDGTKNILINSLQYQKKSLNKIKGFFHASTDKVYGEGSLQTYQEADELKPLPYPYDMSKAKADELVRKVAKENNFPAIIYRFCNVYGPGDYHKSRIIPGTLYRLLYTQEQPVLKIYYDSRGKKQSFYRDMIYIKDLTRAVKLLLDYLKQSPLSSNLIGEVFNLGTENTYPMQDVINKLKLYSRNNEKIKEEIVNSGEIKNQCMNYKKLQDLLGFKPQYSLDQGIKETVAWYTMHKGEIDDKFI